MPNRRRPGYPIFNGFAPAKGPIAVPVTLTYASAPHVIDLYQEVTESVIDFIQSVWVDNKSNGFDAQIDVDITGQRLIVPALMQGVFPIFCPAGAKLIYSTTAQENFTVRILLLSVPMAYAIW